MTWTLWSLMWLSVTGEWGLVKHGVHTTELACRKQELFVKMASKPPSITHVGTVCKLTIDT